MWAWLAIPWVRKIGEVLLLLAALGGVVHWIYHSGRLAGQQEEAGKQTEANRVQFEQIHQTLQQALDAGTARENQLAQVATALAGIVASTSARTEAARQQSATDAAKVQALPDSAVKSDLEVKLGGPLENPAALRKADEIVTDYPHKVDEARSEGETIKALGSTVETAKAQIANAEGQRDAALSAYNELVPLYAQAYNAAIQGHRHWYCLWMCKPKKTLSLPAPATLLKLAAAGTLSKK